MQESRVLVAAQRTAWNSSVVDGPYTRCSVFQHDAYTRRRRPSSLAGIGSAVRRERHIPLPPPFHHPEPNRLQTSISPGVLGCPAAQCRGRYVHQVWRSSSHPFGRHSLTSVCRPPDLAKTRIFKLHPPAILLYPRPPYTLAHLACKVSRPYAPPFVRYARRKVGEKGNGVFGRILKVG